MSSKLLLLVGLLVYYKYSFSNSLFLDSDPRNSIPPRQSASSCHFRKHCANYLGTNIGLTNLCNTLPSFPVLPLMLGRSGPLVYAPNSKCNVGNYYKATIGFFDDVSEQIDQTLIFLHMICMMIAVFVFLLAASISIFWIAVSSSCCW